MTTARAHELFRSPNMQRALDGLRLAIAQPGGVLICGEPGTGRETFAKVIHSVTNGSRGISEESIEELLSGRGWGSEPSVPFLVIDCAATGDIESSLFGRCASGRHDGLERTSPDGALCLALRGTLFLRSVQEMPGRTQTRLARMLRDGQVWLDEGSASREVSFDGRVIAAIDAVSAADDELLVPELKRRLPHRIELPPLRRRWEDLPALVRLMMAKACADRRIPVKYVSMPAMTLLCALPWRRNLNELRALLDTFATTVPKRRVCVADVLAHVRLDSEQATLATDSTLKEARGRFEREYVAAVIEQHRGRMAEAATALGMQRPNLYRKLRQLSVSRASIPARAATNRLLAPERGADRPKRSAGEDSTEML